MTIHSIPFPVRPEPVGVHQVRDTQGTRNSPDPEARAQDLPVQCPLTANVSKTERKRVKGNEGADPNMVGARSQRTLVGQPKTDYGEWLIGPRGVSKEQN